MSLGKDVCIGILYSTSCHLPGYTQIQNLWFFVCTRLDELVVGAPMYSTLEATRFSIERGRVFVFWNTGVCYSLLMCNVAIDTYVLYPFIKKKNSLLLSHRVVM